MVELEVVQSRWRSPRLRLSAAANSYSSNLTSSDWSVVAGARWARGTVSTVKMLDSGSGLVAGAADEPTSCRFATQACISRHAWQPWPEQSWSASATRTALEIKIVSSTNAAPTQDMILRTCAFGVKIFFRKFISEPAFVFSDDIIAYFEGRRLASHFLFASQNFRLPEFATLNINKSPSHSILTDARSILLSRSRLARESTKDCSIVQIVRFGSVGVTSWSWRVVLSTFQLRLSNLPFARGVKLKVKWWARNRTVGVSPTGG